MSAHLDMGGGAEFDAIRSMLDAWGSRASGIGDDASVVDVPAGERLVVSTDATVEEVHFKRSWLDASEVAVRATNAALSDLAAMAARPLGLLLALGLPESWRAELPALARGIGEAASAAQCPIVGGNMSHADRLSLTITVLGSVATPLRRSGAHAGDVLYVTGLLGGPGAALAALLAGQTPRAEHRARFVRPTPRLAEARWLADHGARAAIDISDGLLADAAHLALASRVSLEIDPARIPCMPCVRADAALASGEEYELLVAMHPDVVVNVPEFVERFGTPLTAVGIATPWSGDAVTVRGLRVESVRGHDHLS